MTAERTREQRHASDAPATIPPATVRRAVAAPHLDVPVVAGLVADLSEERDELRRESAGPDSLGGQPLDPGIAAVLARRRGGGSPLPPPVAASMGESLGHDLSGVRVHTDREADQLARSVQSRAFTFGRDIYFSQGSFAPISQAGAHLLAHELAHVTQHDALGPVASGGPVVGRADDPAERRADRVAQAVVDGIGAGAGPSHAVMSPDPAVRRKMWSAKQFSQRTDEGVFVRAGTAQKQLVSMIGDYGSTYEAHGVVLSSDLPKAIGLLLQMRQVAQWWIDDHTTDVDNGLGGVATVEDPKRKKRMAGMKEFRGFLDTEIATLQRQQKTAGEDVTDDIGEAHPGYLKIEQKYTGSASSMFEKLGTLAEKAVSDNGDSTTIEIAVELPIDPNGIGFLGGRFQAQVSKDDNLIKVRGELAITGGASIDFAKVAAEVGGYLEAQAKTGADAMALLSYAFYRRFRESHVVPNEATNYLWGGNTGSYGKGKSEAWSLAMEQRIFAELTGAEQDNVYVETGGLLGAKAALDATVLKGEVGVGYSEGRKIDFKSLKNRKGGAGQQNLPSDSIFAKGARALTGGTRGAQKSVGRSVRALSLSSTLSTELAGVGALGWQTKLGLGWESDGMSVTRTGVEPTVSMTKNALEITLSGGLRAGQLLGPAGEKLFSLLADKLVKWIREQVLPAAAEKEPSTAAQVVRQASTAAALIRSANPSSSSALSSLATTSGQTSLRIVVSLNGVNGGGSIEILRDSENKLEIPKALQAKLTRSKRIVKFTLAGETWTAS